MTCFVGRRIEQSQNKMREGDRNPLRLPDSQQTLKKQWPTAEEPSATETYEAGVRLEGVNDSGTGAHRVLRLVHHAVHHQIQGIAHHGIGHEQ